MACLVAACEAHTSYLSTCRGQWPRVIVLRRSGAGSREVARGSGDPIPRIGRHPGWVAKSGGLRLAGHALRCVSGWLAYGACIIMSKSLSGDGFGRESKRGAGVGRGSRHRKSWAACALAAPHDAPCVVSRVCTHGADVYEVTGHCASQVVRRRARWGMPRGCMGSGWSTGCTLDHS